MSLIKKQKSFFAAIIAGSLTFLLLGFFVLNSQEQQKKVQAPVVKHEYVIASVDIKKGNIIKEEDVEIKNFPIELEGIYKATGEVIGRTASQDLEKGAPFSKNMVTAIVTEKKEDSSNGPNPNFRGYPILVKKGSVPPYLSTDARFDLITKENTMKIENLKILNILNSSTNDDNKIIVLEIHNKDIDSFSRHKAKTKGFIFLQKNPKEYGKYNFHDMEEEQLAYERLKEQKALDALLKMSSTKVEASLPPAPNSANDIPIIGDIGFGTRQVEVIVGNKKTKMEF